MCRFYTHDDVRAHTLYALNQHMHTYTLGDRQKQATSKSWNVVSGYLHICQDAVGSQVKVSAAALDSQHQGLSARVVDHLHSNTGGVASKGASCQLAGHVECTISHPNGSATVAKRVWSSTSAGPLVSLRMAILHLVQCKTADYRCRDGRQGAAPPPCNLFSQLLCAHVEGLAVQ